MSFANLAHPPTVWDRSPLWRDMDRLFGPLRTQAFPVRRRAPAQPRSAAFAPNVDLEKMDEGYTLSVELPGFEADEFDVEVEDGSLTIKGAKTVKVEAEGDEADEGEETRTHKEFVRRFRLGKDVDVEAVKASYSNGLLIVSLPKAVESANTRTIPVTTA